MVDISLEDDEATDARLRMVTRLASLHVYPDAYSYAEFPLERFTIHARPDALALVRDDELWSQLVPAGDDAAQRFKIFRFHFPPGIDNSGFVGWLASHLKRRFGTGVVVICGQNSRSGGIYDYWGCPSEIGQEVTQEVMLLSG